MLIFFSFLYHEYMGFLYSPGANLQFIEITKS